FFFFRTFFKDLQCCLDTNSVIFVKRASLTFIKMVKRGTTVSLLCSNILKDPSYIAWFKLTNDSLPLCIVTQHVGEKPADSIYFNGFKKNHVEMSVNKTLSSLKIVNFSFELLVTFIYSHSTSIVCLQFLYCQEEDADFNYSALSLDKKKSRRPVRRLKEVESNVVYAATR
uniref:Immunoglobulin V-set domain-containing protein n=1 Tax=Sinocyclocheilus anshuiensis TaxID=1608454 RepID=A0A671QRF3_9TELE